MWFIKDHTDEGFKHRLQGYIERELESHPENSCAHAFMGWMSIYDLDFSAAEAFLLKARELGMENRWTVMCAYWLAVALFCQGKFAQARQVFRDDFCALRDENLYVSPHLKFQHALDAVGTEDIPTPFADAQQDIFWTLREYLLDAGQGFIAKRLLCQEQVQAENVREKLTHALSIYQQQNKLSALSTVLAHLPYEEWRSAPLACLHADCLAGNSYADAFHYLDRLISEWGELPELCWDFAKHHLKLELWYLEFELNDEQVHRLKNYVEQGLANHEDDGMAYLYLAWVQQYEFDAAAAEVSIRRAQALGLSFGWEVMSNYWLARMLLQLDRAEEAKAVFEEQFEPRALKHFEVDLHMQLKEQIESACEYLQA